MKLDLLELKGKSERNFRGWKIDEHRPADSFEEKGLWSILRLFLFRVQRECSTCVRWKKAIFFPISQIERRHKLDGVI